MKRWHWQIICGGVGVALGCGFVYLANWLKWKWTEDRIYRKALARFDAHTREIEERREAKGWKRDERGRLRPPRPIGQGGTSHG